MVALGFKLVGVAHGLAVSVHGRLDDGVTHQLLLDGERSPCIVHPRSVAVPEGLPSDPISESSLLPSFPDVVLLDGVLVVWSARRRIRE